MKILISGHTGQVAQALQHALADHQLLSLGRQAFDLEQPASLRETVLRERPQLLINAAAYTAVDLAEQEPERAFAVNAEAPGAMAKACAELGIPLIHYSTDYVFDGSKNGAYHEDDASNPLGVYGASKLAGEQAVAASGCEHLILRTSWVYSRHGRNFLLTMQRLLQEREELKVVDDQIGAWSPLGQWPISRHSPCSVRHAVEGSSKVSFTIGFEAAFEGFVPLYWQQVPPEVIERLCNSHDEHN
mgnify:CR=1 FL=1